MSALSRRRAAIHEHDELATPGLPGPLPAGETILWQGVPTWRGLARRGLFLRGIALYFVAMAALRAASLWSDGASPADAVLGGLLLLPIGALPVCLLALFAHASARSTLYTITSRRIVMRVGVALPMTITIPFVLIDSAAVSRHADGTGDIVVSIAKPHRVSWLALWPHIRPSRITRPQPMLRALVDADIAALVLSQALAAAAPTPAEPEAASLPVHAPALV